MNLYIKAGGAVLIVAAGIMSGLGVSRELSRKVREIEDMIASLGIMRSEIELRLTPMPDIFYKLSERRSSTTQFYKALCEDISRTEGESLGLIWERTAVKCFKETPARRVFSELGSSLGYFDAESECAVITYTCGQLINELENAKEDSAVRGSLAKRLGAAAGIGIAIILL